MTFWLIGALTALLVLSILALGFFRPAGSRAAPAAFDVQVYRDQLKELDRDLARGTIPGEEAERARLEISRRLLDADRKASSAGADSQAPAAATFAALGLIAVLILGGGYALYDRLGAPGYSDMPLKARIAAASETRDARPGQREAEADMPPWAGPPPDAPRDYIDLVTKLRAAVAARPGELQGQFLLATHEAALGNFVAAYEAQLRVVEIRGAAATADDFALLADLMVSAAGGYVSPEAEAVLARALERDPTQKISRYYLGLMYAQTGRPDLAFQFWAQLLREGPADARWYLPVRRSIGQLAMLAGVNNYQPPEPLAAAPGPSAADIEAAGEMSAEDRRAMIDSMVARLSERLASEGGPAADWARLINALGVLGETERARAIWAEAQQVFSGDPQGLQILRDAAGAAGVLE